MPRKQRKIITREIYSIAIRLLTSGQRTITQVAQDLNISRMCLSNLLKKHEQGVVFIPANEKYKETCRQRRESFGEIEQTLYTSIVCNNSQIQSELIEEVRDRHGVTLTQSTMSRKLKSINLSRKRTQLIPFERNTAEQIRARALFAAELTRISDNNLIYLDETGFNQHTRRHYGYSPINSRAIEAVPANRGVNRSLMCAIGVHGIVAHEYVSGSYNADRFMGFIENKLVPYFQLNPSKILVMDNVRFHKTSAVIQLLQEKRIAYKYLVPYSPELNPIEEFFSALKARFTTLRNSDRTLSIEQCIDQIFTTNNDLSEMCAGFYRSMRRWIEKAIRSEPFI